MNKRVDDSLDWLDLETDVTAPPSSVGDLIVREEENNTWSVLRSVDGTDPEVDPGYQSKDDALQAARLGAEGGKITIERRTSTVIAAAKIHAGMIAKLGGSLVTITGIDGHDISIMHASGEEQLVDASELSNIKEAFGDEAYPMYQDGKPEIGHMPGMKMDDGNPLIKLIEELEDAIEGPEEDDDEEEESDMEDMKMDDDNPLMNFLEELEEAIEGPEEDYEESGMEDMMLETEPGMEGITMEIEPVDPLLEESEIPDDEYVLDIGIPEEEAEEGTEDMAGMMTGPPVYIVDMKSMPGENQSKGAQKTAKVHMSQEKGERPIPRIDIKGILDTYERIGIPVSAAEAKIGEMLLVKDADVFHIEEELVNGAVQRKAANIAQEAAEGILATIGFNSNTAAQLISTATKKGHVSLGDQMGFLVKADHYLIMTAPGTYSITDEVSVIAEGLDQFRAYDLLSESTSLDPDALSDAFNRAQTEPEVQLTETFGEERGFQTGPEYDLDAQPTSIPDGSDAGMEGGSGFESAIGIRKIRIANVKIAKEAPTCKKCGKSHWPFQKCDSAGKKDETAKDEKDLEGSDEPATTAAKKCDKCGKEDCTCDKDKAKEKSKKAAKKCAKCGKEDCTCDKDKAKEKSKKEDNSEDTSEAMRTAKSAPTCKKCGKPHWPFKPCSGSEKEDKPEKAEEDSAEKEASRQLNITALSTGAFQQLQAKVKRQAAVKDNPKLDEQCILLDREAKRRELPDHKYNVYQRVIVTAKDLPKTAGMVVEYGQDKYLVLIANKHQLWFKEAEVSPTSNPDTTTVPWTQRSKKIVDPENSKQNADFKKDLSAKTGQSPAELTLEGVASEIVDAVAPEAALRDWASGERGSSYEELVEGAFEAYRDALLTEAQAKFPQIAEHADLGPQLEMTLKDVLSWNLPKGNSGEDMRGMSLEDGMAIGPSDWLEPSEDRSDEVAQEAVNSTAYAIAEAFFEEHPEFINDTYDDIVFEHEGLLLPLIEKYAEEDDWDLDLWGAISSALSDVRTSYASQGATANEMAMGEETTIDEMAMGDESAEMKRDYRDPDAYGRSYAMKIGTAVRIASTFKTKNKEVAALRDLKIIGSVVALNKRIADVQIGTDILRIARSGLEITGHFFRDSIIRRCAPGDIDPDRPDSAQEWCLCSSKNDTVLGRHATKKEAVQQEKAIKAKGGIFIAAEIPEAIVDTSIADEKKAIDDYEAAISALPTGSADAEVLKEIQQDEKDHLDIFNKLKDGEDATALLAEANCGKPHGTEKGTAAGPPDEYSRANDSEANEWAQQAFSAGADRAEAWAADWQRGEYIEYKRDPADYGVPKDDISNAWVSLLNESEGKPYAPELWAGVLSTLPVDMLEELSQVQPIPDDVLSAAAEASLAGTAAGPPIGGMPGAAGDSDQKGKPASAPPGSPAKGDKPEALPEETCVCPLDGKEYPKEAGVPCTNSSCTDHSDVQLVRKPTGPPPKEPVKKAFMQLAKSVRCYADALLERVLTGNITSSEAIKELNAEAKRWDWSSTQKKFVKNRLQGKVAHMKRMSAEDDVSSLLNELERGDAQAVIRTLDDSTEVSEALTGLGLGDDTSDLRSWLIDAPGMSAELLQIYAQDPVPANRLLALDRIAERFPEADVSAWLQDPYPYISEKAAEIQAGAGSPLALEDPLAPVDPIAPPAPITPPVPAADPGGQVNVPLAAAKDTPPGNAPPTVDYDPLGLIEEDDTTKKKAEAGRLALTYDEPNARYLLYNMDFGSVAPEGAQIKDIKGQLEAYGICSDRIQAALDAAKNGVAVIKIARVANADNIDIELSDAVDAAVLGFSDKSAMEGLTDGSSRGSLTMSALLEASKRLGISKEDTSSYYGDRIKELLDVKLAEVPRPEIPGTKQEFMSFQSKKPPVSKEAKTPTPEERKQMVTDLAKHGIPLREMTPANEPPVDIPPDRMLSTIGIFKKGDRVKDNAVTELKGTVTGFDTSGNIIVAMDQSVYCPDGGEGLYPPEGLVNMRL